MRLHHLALRAFGPFAGLEEVDFDELCDAGLFLLTGPTGAGKTTILDAVCFALYGSVPGVRGVKALKSQHAADDSRPEVVLDFSVRERRFVVRRAPEWSRPKRRGAGFTTENASATLVETTSGTDRLLSSRAQEIGHLIGELIGMQSTQFVQVAMLPQGDFQKFLRAPSQDRHDVLQHLFRTDRYARIEDWVHDHSRELRERSAAGQHEVVRILDAVADRAAATVPVELGGDRLLTSEASTAASTWVDGLVDAAGLAEAAALDQHDAAARTCAAARERHAEALRDAELRRRRDEAAAALRALAQDAAPAEEAVRTLDADTRASRCDGLAAMLSESVTVAARTAEALEAAAADLTGDAADGIDLPDHPTADALAELEQRTRAAVARMEALAPRERELAEARQEAARGQAQLTAVSAETSRVEERAGMLPGALAQARADAADVAASAARLEALTLELEGAARRLGAAREAEACDARLPELLEVESQARERSLDARERLQDLTARRLAGFAAELAGRLSPGDACQVCGSREHPEPATGTSDQVGEREQTEAQSAYDLAADAHVAASGEVLRARERLAALRAAAGADDVGAADAVVSDLDARVRHAAAAAERLGPAETAVAALEEEQRALTSVLHSLALRTAGLTQSVQAHERTIERLTAELAAEVDGDRPVAEEAERLHRLAEAFARTRQARCDHDEALARVGELASRTDQAAREQGFPDAEALTAARLTEPERRRLEQLLAERARAETRARAVLEDDEVSALDGREVLDPTPLAAALDVAEREEADAARSLHLREAAHTALRRQRGRLAQAMAEWAPVRAEYLRADRMSRLVRGMGEDNRLQMRLSAYVLATRLDQVVAAANERLSEMRDQRYLLQRTGRVARKGAQAGLGLEVLDQWTGAVRDPATLSGGETFVVSLSLALGLADVVSQEAGGTEIETLFVDEGFGTLDVETLDDVMDRLDELRAGGRAVGVVSHVSELRNRIPTQLHVEKLRTGSAVTVRTAVG